MTASHYRELEVWKLAMALATHVYQLTAAFCERVSMMLLRLYESLEQKLEAAVPGSRVPGPGSRLLEPKRSLRPKA